MHTTPLRTHLRTLAAPLAIAAIAAIAAACSSSGEAAAPTTATARETETGDGGVVATCDDADGGGASSGASAPRTDADSANAWLHGGSYRCWKHESKAHPSTGPHASSVLTYVNGTLDRSLAAGGANGANGANAKGSIAVKEFLGPDGTVTGWALSVKTSDASDEGNGWYWYETFSTTKGKHGIEGRGAGICVDCHASGRDYVLAPYPLH